jgi:dethiobiotin synthetase
MRGLFVTGTDTGVGKTIVSAALVAAMRSAGERPRAYKPVITGLDDLPPAGSLAWPRDHELLGAAAGMDSALVSPISYGPAVSPHLAAELAGERITAERLLDGARVAASAEPPGPLVVEGVGGLLVPLNEEWTVCDLAAALALPVVIAARPGLGTINHTLLTLRVAREAGLDVRAVVLTPWPPEPSRMELSNRETIARIGAVEVATLRRVQGPDQDELASAGSALPWRRWLV